MKRWTAAWLLLLVLTISALAQTTHRKLDGWCEQGGRRVNTAGQISSTTVQQSMPACTVTIFIAGTGTPASICSDNVGPTCTPKANPFTADVNGYWSFFAASGQYDLVFTGGIFPNTFPSTFTRSSIMVPSPFTGASAVTGPGSSTDNAIVRWDGTTGTVIQNSTVIVGDTGNVTGLGTLNTHTIPAVAADTFILGAANQVIGGKIFGSGNTLVGPFTVALGSDATGDIYYRNSGGILTRLAIGSSGQVLTVSGGLPSWATGSSPPFTDTTSIVQGSSDSTKQIRFEVDGLTTGTTRVLTVPDMSFTLAGVDVSNNWADGAKQTFNPNATNAGINVGAHTTDPSLPANGDCYYNSSTNELRCRINGTWIALGAGGGGGGGSPGGNDGNIQYRVNSSTFGGIPNSFVTALGEVSFLGAARSSGGSVKMFRVDTVSDTGLTADTESVYGAFGSSATRQFTGGGGSFTQQREWIFTAPTYAFTSADVITTAATMAITNAPIAGTNATISNPLAFWVQAGFSLFGGKVRTTSNGNDAGINIGSTTGDPLFATNGDLYYNSTANELRARINGAWVALGSGGGGGSPGGADGNLQYRVNSTTFGGITGSSVTATTFEIAYLGVARTSGGATRRFRLGTTADTGLTADTESIYTEWGGDGPPGTVTRTFTQGAAAFPVQREYIFVRPTYAFSGSADSITTAATVAITGAPVAGANATLGVPLAFWVQGGDSKFEGLVSVGVAAGTASAAQMHVASVLDTTPVLLAVGTGTQTADIFRASRGGSQVFVITAQGPVIITPVALSAGTPNPDVTVTTPTHVDLSNAEVPSIRFNLNATINLTGGGGAITNQRSFRTTAPTFTGDAAQTITNAATVAISGAPVASTNITITNTYALWVEDGKAQFTPNSTFAGVNVGSTTANPSSPTNGDIYYNSTANELRARINSGWVALGAGGGGGTTINPSDNFVPYRINSTTFDDSSISLGASKATQFAITARSSTTSSYAFRFLTPADTALTASTEAPMLQMGANVSQTTVTREWATGALTTQREHIFFHPTYAFVGASTLTNAATVAITNAPIAGTNATITNRFALWVQTGAVRLGTPSTSTGSIQLAVSGDADVTTIQAGDTPASAVTYKWPADDPAATEFLKVTSFSGGVATLEWAAGGGGSGCTPAGSQGDYQINNGAGGCAAGVITQGTNGRVIASPTAASSGVNPYLRIVAPADTAQTADTEFPGIFLGGSSSGATVTRQGADGTTYTTQREVIVPAPTYGFVGATTVTNAVTFSIVDAPIAGTNATLSNRRAFRVEAGQSQFPAGSSSVASILFNADGFGNSGIWSESNTDVCFLSNGSFVGGFHAGGGGSNPALVLTNGSAMSWTTSGGISGATDLSLVRHAAGVLRLQDGQGSGTAGQLLIGGSGDTIGAQLDVRAEATGTIGFRVDSLANSTVDLARFNLNTSQTAAGAVSVNFQTNSNGTAANGFGTILNFNLETSTTNDQNAAQIGVIWSDVTHASRTSFINFATINNATGAERMRVDFWGIQLSAVTFANLGTPANGHVTYCSDCTIANPCAGSGGGAIAKRLGGAWVCN